MRNHWQTIDTQTLLQRRQQEQTTSANVGAYPVPLGQPLRRQMPEPVGTNTPLGDLRRDDEEFRRALRSMGWID